MKTNTEKESGDVPPDDSKQSAAFLRTAAELVGDGVDGSEFMRAMGFVQGATGTLTPKKDAGTMKVSSKKSGSDR
ncbi:hypothetical protein [Polaromonas eurypsychrophila]|uniref:Uncharacterized protein n=1 Tax=Polaromonas eurypsychrophila TaxID=1614635 RepID=A0A916WMU0_9BURK|nr:hypothetical protein [Polaromonas eurypsychrophila]GGB12808.1 hypothetical protein GCM10011496_37130 [Polaromonas eurypsychrophila]